MYVQTHSQYGEQRFDSIDHNQSVYSLIYDYQYWCFDHYYMLSNIIWMTELLVFKKEEARANKRSEAKKNTHKKPDREYFDGYWHCSLALQIPSLSLVRIYMLS